METTMRKLALALTTTTLILGAGAALTQTAPATTPPGPGGATGSIATPATPNAAGAVRPSASHAIHAVKIPLSQAIDTAEKQGGAGRAISAEFEEPEGNKPATYEIKVVYDDGRLVEHYVDANSGQVIRSENQPFERYFTRLKASDFQNARTSLKDAVTLAEQRGGAGAKAIEADVDREGASVVYEIEVVTADRSQEFKVDANGQVQASN
jgi:uncharacterized membrane protein YkoI